MYAQPAGAFSLTNAIGIAELQGSVEVFPKDAAGWRAAQTNDILHPQDRLHTANNSRVALRWSDQSIVSFGASTELEILAPGRPDEQAGLHLIRGVISFFHRDKPGRIHIVTRGAAAGVEGTEFVLAVNDADATTLSVVDGKVRFGNDQSTLLLTNGDQAVVELGAAPRRTAGFIANNLLQWCFYYPAVVDPDELQLTDGEQKDLAGSLAAYRSGDLLAALDQYPAGRSNVSAPEHIYHAALLLSVGEVAQAEAALSTVSDKAGTQKLSDALRQLIAAVKRQPSVTTGKPELASELMAASYFEQSRAVRETSLRKALELAKQATMKSPKFGFAWERAAELEFSFGQTKPALEDLNRSLALSPHNAQALALKGFILAAQNEPKQARAWFDRAIAADSALGNAWLGRGLTRIHLGDNAGGRQDLLVAAALEPQRAELRSYLGKAYAHAGDDAHATKELALAKKLDPNDPTAWLYSALVNQRDNQINDAIRDLEKSQSLNGNRSVYRSQLLLDEDQAVRSANLAGMYQDAGMFDLSMREAGRAVSSDYANYSAHLFLASSFDQMRDPNWSNLRYETPSSSEFWIANLLAPTSAGWQSAIASEQPYSKLFDKNRVGVVSESTYLGRGAWTERGAQFGTYDNFSYGVEAKYQSDPGQRPNNDVEHRDLNVTLKYQFTPQDSAFFTYDTVDINQGDLNEYYNQANAFTAFRDKETQQPNLYLGYHHEWSSGVHTLFMASRQVGSESAAATNAAQYIEFLDSPGHIFGEGMVDVGEHVAITPELNSTELQQIWETPNHTTIVGTRFEWGDIRYQNYEWLWADPAGDGGFFPPTSDLAQQDFSANFHHYNVYGYHTWQITDPLSLTAGLSYDWLHAPADVASTPFATQEKTTIQFSPKAGFVWQPSDHTVVRGAYTRSLSGYANGQSTRLEPTEVAGFNQAFRSLVPESVAGDSSGSKFDTFEFSLEQKFDTGTYLSLSGEVLYSKLNKLQGGFDFLSYIPANVTEYPIYPLGLRQSENYREESLVFTMDQLLGRQWSVGAVYRLSEARLDLNYLDFAPGFNNPDPSFQGSQGLKSILNTVDIHANWNHPSGLFSILSADWYHQNNSGFNNADPLGEPGDDFWQCNAYVGYRAWHRRLEFTVGLLNIFNQGYRLEPLDFYNEMAHSRTFLARLRISF
ncbi:MAG: TonB-dependent receptor [Verrucomicrobiae bacterium]|nr:TonB-dependent receptor [Verrucomicrobiae bacterium]